MTRALEQPHFVPCRGLQSPAFSPHEGVLPRKCAGANEWIQHWRRRNGICWRL